MTEQEKQPDTDQATASGPAQHQRWVVYGSNVVIFCLTAIAIAVLVNWLGATQLKKLGDYARYDLTATRDYTLSPQTRNLLESIDANLEIVLLYAAGTRDETMMTQVEDLLDEYQSRAGNITVRHIDPTTDPKSFETLTEKLLDRYEDELKVTQQTIEDAKKLYSEIGAFAEQQTEVLGDLFAKVGANDPALIRTIQTLGTALRTTPKQIESVLKDLAAATEDEELPDYGLITRATSTNFRRFKAAMFEGAVFEFRRAAEADTTPDAVKDQILGLSKKYQAFVDRIDETTARLDAISVGKYDEFRAKIAESNGVVIYKDRYGDDDERRGMIALPLSEIYPIVGISRTDAGDVERRIYQGEEAITGALFKLASKPTKIVFINSNRAPVLGRNGELTFNVIASQLVKMNFVIEEWQPGQTTDRFGRPAPPRPVPTAEPGQNMVFILVPNIEPVDPQRPVNPANAAATRAVLEHVAAGGSAMFFIAPNLSGGAMTNDPIVQLLASFGVNVNRDAAVQTRVPNATGQLVSTFRVFIEDYDTTHPVSVATNGLRSYLMAGIPVEIAPQMPEGVTATALALTPDDTWAETNLSTLGRATQSSDEKGGPFAVAVAADRQGQRVVTFGDVYFGTDQVVAFRNSQTRKLEFPGNGELFANSIFWASGLDDMIATGARSQDTRRIEPFTHSTRRAMWWALLAGLPLLCLVIGLAVHTVRRR